MTIGKSPNRKLKMAKAKTKFTDVRLTTGRLYELLLDPKFATDYIVFIAGKRNEAMLRRAVEDLITAFCIRHQLAGRDEKAKKVRPRGTTVIKRVRSLGISCNSILRQRILKVWKHFSSDSVDVFLCFLLSANSAVGVRPPLELLRSGETDRVIRSLADFCITRARKT